MSDFTGALDVLNQIVKDLEDEEKKATNLVDHGKSPTFHAGVRAGLWVAIEKIKHTIEEKKDGFH